MNDDICDVVIGLSNIPLEALQYHLRALPNYYRGLYTGY